MDRATSSHRLAGSGLRKFTLDFVIVIIFKNAKNCKWLQDFIIVISFQIIYVVTNIFFCVFENKNYNNKIMSNANFASPEPDGHGFCIYHAVY